MRRFKKELERLKKELADLEEQKKKNKITFNAISRDKLEKKTDKKF